MSVVIESMVDEKIVERFQRLILSGRLAHAYLFIGPQGCGKTQTAVAIAKLVNCELEKEMYCGECVSCRKISSGNHPDILVCDQGEDKSIKIQKVRELVERIQLQPYEAKRKVVIFKDIDLLTIEGANAFLKTLEEPTASSLLLLTTANPERILGTVKSRCHMVYFSSCSREKLSHRLQKEMVSSELQADVISGFSEGCYGQARGFFERDFMASKNVVIDEFLFRAADDTYLKAVLSDEQATKEALDVLLFCFKDLMLLNAGVSDKQITNSDRIADLRACAARYSLDQLRNILAEVVNTKKMLDANFNVKVPLMLLKEKIWTRS